MTLATILSTATLLGLFHPYRGEFHKVYGIDDWRLTITTDTFTKDAHCVIENRYGKSSTVTFEGGIWTFHFANPIVLSDVVYKLGEGSPRKWTDSYAELLGSGHMALAEEIDNSIGVVQIPSSIIKKTPTLSIQWKPMAKPVVFNLTIAQRLIESIPTPDCPT